MESKRLWWQEPRESTGNQEATREGGRHGQSSPSSANWVPAPCLGHSSSGLEFLFIRSFSKIIFILRFESLSIPCAFSKCPQVLQNPVMYLRMFFPMPLTHLSFPFPPRCNIFAMGDPPSLPDFLPLPHHNRYLHHNIPCPGHIFKTAYKTLPRLPPPFLHHLPDPQVRHIIVAEFVRSAPSQPLQPFIRMTPSAHIATTMELNGSSSSWETIHRRAGSCKITGTSRQRVNKGHPHPLPPSCLSAVEFTIQPLALKSRHPDSYSLSLHSQPIHCTFPTAMFFPPVFWLIVSTPVVIPFSAVDYHTHFHFLPGPHVVRTPGKEGKLLTSYRR